MENSMEYQKIQKKLAKGWNTWDVKSVLTHVLLPENLALRISVLKNHRNKKLHKKNYLKNVIPKSYILKIASKPKVTLSNRTYDGKYTNLTLDWAKLKFRIQSVSIGKNIALLITPLRKSKKSRICIEFETLWGSTGQSLKENNILIAKMENNVFQIRGTINPLQSTQKFKNPKLFFPITESFAIYTGEDKSYEEISQLIEKEHNLREKEATKYGDLGTIYNAIQGALAWNTIYDPTHKRVITPVSRSWAQASGGFVLFEWDTYFASYLATIDNKDLSYANAIEMTKAITPSGFVPNFTCGNGDSLDRSQPPVGTLMIREIYRRYQEKWFLEEVYEELLQWNRWWDLKRYNNGYLCWGTNPQEGKKPSKQDAMYESGLDNSPMFFSAIATILGNNEDSEEIQHRAEKYKNSLTTLWDEDKGIYLNLHLDRNEKSNRLSPTLFYPLIGKVPSQEQAERMISEHYFNKSEFHGDWVMPSTARNDPNFLQNYWRGRIWGSMNFLVYLGLKNYNLPLALKDLVEKSKKLLLKEYEEKTHVHENYNSKTGEGDDVLASSQYYHWGALLGFMSIIEEFY